MVILVLVMPILLLGALLGMHRVESWLDREPTEPRLIQAEPALVPAAGLISPRRA